MIISLLYSSSLLQSNIRRNIYLYALGMIIYVIIHWILFSSIGDKYVLIQKYRNMFYLIVVCDIIYITKKYKEFANTILKQHSNKSPIITELTDKMSHCENNHCENNQCKITHHTTDPQEPKEESKTEPKDNHKSDDKSNKHDTKLDEKKSELPHIKDSSSVVTLPVYKSHTSQRDNPDDIPVYVKDTNEQKNIIDPRLGVTQPMADPRSCAANSMADPRLGVTQPMADPKPEHQEPNM